ncbi:restriction endonuclease subunit S [Pseudomonas graminis]|uniref:restriction endonuclease subunit S n=1 Tax=Pseudomonas graminis TaxID=158627 RepID=UPI002349B3B0|nr:restriction endonuclease subunit S [Pseudomonas graminis]MDC6380398.1 restriction endonuclease subunit S [Pseudomonas graminis]
MTFPKYPAYKDSGVEWLGEMPAHWVRGSLKNLAWIRNGKDYKDVESSDGEYPVIGSGGMFSKASHYLHDGESVLLGRKGTIDKPLYINGRFWTVDTMFYTEVAKGTSAKFFYYYALTIPFGFYSTSTALPSMTQGDLLNHPAAIPPEFEQTQIARFLDHETARIDALIEEQHRLIALLKEKRQAVISHAVTKGLDPTMPMKDSGVEWLGEVPEHWQQIRIKHVLTAMIDAEHKTAEYHDDGEYLVCRTTNVRNGRLNLEGGKYTDKATYIEWTRRGKPEPLDILFTREAPAGEACLVPSSPEICLGQRMVLFKLNKRRIDPDFLVHSIYAGLASDFVKQLSQGSTVSHFNMADIGNIPLYEAPLSEQRDISNFLAARCGAYDSLIQEAELSVELISERRSALISAAVTGKIDVRGWKPPTSALSPELEEEAV